jgi:hypothetical protein
MKGKYKRKRLNKKYKKYAEQFRIWRENPSILIEDTYDIKLSLWQKIYINKILKLKRRITDCV